MIPVLKPKPTGEELLALTEVIESGWWGMGPKVEEFEKAWAEKTGAKFAVATNSCTSALDIACRLGVLPNPVKVTAFTFVSSALAPLNAGYDIEFVDIDEDNLCTPNADIQVFYGGNQFGKGIVYDMAHCGGAKHHGLISCWSFHAVKNLPSGDGGMLTTNDPELYRRAKALSWCGIDKSTWERSGKKYAWDYDIDERGIKAHMNDITAAIGLCHLKKLDENNEYRRSLARVYDHALPNDVIIPKFRQLYHIYTIRAPKRDELFDYLAEKGIGCGVHYKPLYKYPIFPNTELPITEKVFQDILTLPLHLELTKEDVETICSHIKDFYG